MRNRILVDHDRTRTRTLNRTRERIVDGQSSKVTTLVKPGCGKEVSINPVVYRRGAVTEQHVAKKTETFYTLIAKVLNDNGPLAVSIIYEKLATYIDVSANKNWKNSVRHALSSKTAFFRKIGKNETGRRGNIWGLVDTYENLVTLQPKLYCHRKRVITEAKKHQIAKQKIYCSHLFKYHEYLTNF